MRSKQLWAVRTVTFLVLCLGLFWLIPRDARAQTQPCTTLPVTASHGSFSPHPVAVGEDSFAALSASTQSPSGTTGCSLSGPSWSWSIVSTEYSVDDTSYAPATPNYVYIDHPNPGSASATAVLNAPTGGYWKVTCRATVSFSNNCGSCWTGDDDKDGKAKDVEIEKVIEDGSMPEDEGPLATAVGKDVTVRAKPKAPATFPAGKPTWAVTKKPMGSAVAAPAAGATAKITPDKVGEYELEATCGTSKKTIIVYAIKVVFTEDAAQKYGFDNQIAPATADDPWKSVEKGQKDKATATIDPAAAANKTFFTSSDVAKFKITPAQATASPQTVEVEGVAKGQAVAEARAGKATGPVAGKMNVWVREKRTKSVGIRLIHCEKDDIQAIPKDKGKPNTVCIKAAAMMGLKTKAADLKGDDTIDGTTVTTGPDGICQTTAAMGDTQEIAVGNGKSGEVCVHPGVNNKRDTKAAGDDVVDGEAIKTGPNGICNTTAATANLTSTDVTVADVTTHLNSKVYNQAVFEWQVTKLQPKTVRWDLNQDGKLSDGGAWPPAEMKAINDEAADPGYDYMIYIVSRSELDIYGRMGFGSSYGFVYADTAPFPPKTVAHELGHGAFSLRHTDGTQLGTPADPDNIMMQGAGSATTLWRLRKFQWDVINP